MSIYTFNHYTPDIHPTVFIASTAQIIGNVRIGKDSSIWFQSVIRGDMDMIRIGERTNIQDLCMGHADEHIPLRIGNGVTVGHRCIVHGCTIEDDCLVGMGAIIMNHTVVGHGSVIAAGAVILEKTIIPPYSLVAGSPGKIKKTYEDSEQIEHDIRTMSETYMENARLFARDRIFFESSIRS